MTAPFNPGDVLTISTASYQARKFTVVSMNFGPATRAVLSGGRGAHRVLVKIGPGADDWAIHEDDGEKNRGRPCTVDDVEPAPTSDAGRMLVAKPEPRAVAHARVMETRWGIVSTENQRAAAESLADALVKLHAQDLRGARASAEAAIRKLTQALAFEYVARHGPD